MTTAVRKRAPRLARDLVRGLLMLAVMKKPASAKLTLSRHTLRSLSGEQLAAVDGAGPTGACTYSGCQYTGCSCDTTASYSVKRLHCPSSIAA